MPLADVLDVAAEVRVSVVLDVFRHSLAPSLDGLDTHGLVDAAGDTWREDDGRQEAHFSTQAPGRRPGAHAQSVDLDAFAAFVDAVGDLPLDCVLEVKDKEQSVFRAHALLTDG